MEKQIRKCVFAGTFDPLTLSYMGLPENATTLTAAAVKYPVSHDSGDGFLPFGVIYSPNNIIFGEAKVVDASDNVIFSVGVAKEDEVKICCPSGIAILMETKDK